MAGAPKNQHYVPQVYLKAWETEVCSKAEPEKRFFGIYVFSDGEKIGNGTGRNSVFWERNIYTVSFDQLFIAQKCPKILTDFVDRVYEILRKRSPQPVFGKNGYCIIKTKKSIRKHILMIDDWEFYYDDGRTARKAGILNDIHGLNSFLIENGLDSVFETKWESTLSHFLSEMSDPNNAQIGRSERVINFNTAKSILSFFLMMYFRSPRFDGMGLYSWLTQEILEPVLGEGSEYLISGVWHTELYRMLFNERAGHFHTLLETMLEKCQMILYETDDDSGSFITSDNPAFQNKSLVPEIQNMNGFIFPLSPRFLVFIARGTEGYNVVDYRLADASTVVYFNQQILRNKTKTIVSNKKMLPL